MAFDSARHYDAQVLHWFGEQANCITLAPEMATRPGVFDRVIEVANQHPPYQTPGPDHATLESLVL